MRKILLALAAILTVVPLTAQPETESAGLSYLLAGRLVRQDEA